MGQPGFFDVSDRYASLDARKDPLVQIAAVVPFEEFRSRLEAVWRKPGEKRTSAAGRKPWDAVVMLKAIILCELYNLSDEQVEYQVRDRLSFMRFLGLGLEDPVPDARTIRLDREQLAQAGEVKPLFSAFDDHLKGRGSLAMGGQLIDASIVPVPGQGNKREENATIKAGDTPEAWKEKPARLRRKDCDARWTRKNGQSHYGNQTRSKVRVRVEHVFGAQSNDMGGPLIRSIGLVRAKARIGLRNLACNMRRAVQLDHLDAAPG